MRILYVYDINEVAESYGENMASRGHSVGLYKPSLKGASASLPIKLALMPGRILSMRHILGSLSPSHFDLVHINWASYGILGLMSRIPYIVHCHGTDVRHSTFNPILAPIFRHAAAVICITPDLIPYVQPIRPDAIFLPGSIDTDRFIPVETNKDNPKIHWTILLFTRLIPEKGLEIATQGIAKFAQRHPETHVKLVDWGTEAEKYKQLYRNRFEFIPRVAPKLVPHLIRSADVVVGQFLSGALGLSELQAMSCAKPVIASFRYEEAYPVPPPLCQATTAQEVDEHLENLYQHPEVATKLGQSAREWIIKYHDSQILATKLEKLYQSILNGRTIEQNLINDLPCDLKSDITRF